MNWNAGGWFGGQIGATVWMLVAGVLTAFRHWPAGLLVVALFAIPNALGWYFWRSRRLSCYASSQWLIAVAGSCGLAVVYVLDSVNAWSAIQTSGQVSAEETYWIIALVFSGIMLSYYWRFGRRRVDS